MILIGAIFIIIGILNCFGYIKTIHYYNRRNVTQKNRKSYGKVVGTAMIVMGASAIISWIIEFVTKNELAYIGVLLGCIIGVVLILYAQFKYNKGVF